MTTLSYNPEFLDEFAGALETVALELDALAEDLEAFPAGSYPLRRDSRKAAPALLEALLKVEADARRVRVALSSNLSLDELGIG